MYTGFTVFLDFMFVRNTRNTGMPGKVSYLYQLSVDRTVTSYNMAFKTQTLGYNTHT